LRGVTRIKSLLFSTRFNLVPDRKLDRVRCIFAGEGLTLPQHPDTVRVMRVACND
jgi:hypothetical protein